MVRWRRVEVERGDAAAGRGQRDRGVHRRRRLAGAALFVGEDDEMRLAHARPLVLDPPRVAKRGHSAQLIGGESPVQTVRDAADSWQTRWPRFAPAASAWRWCRRWARSTPGIWRWSRKRRRQADRVVATIFVNPHAVRRRRGPRPLSAPGGGGRARRWRTPAATCCGCPTAEQIYPPGFATTSSACRS